MFISGGDDGLDLVFGVLIWGALGAFFGAIPLTVGLLRGHRQMAWLGFALCVFVGIAFCFAAIVPAIIFTLVVALSEPIEKGRKKKNPKKKPSRRSGSYNVVRDDDDEEDYDERPSRRRSRRDDEDDEDDRPRRRRRRDDDDE